MIGIRLFGIVVLCGHFALVFVISVGYGPEL